MPFYHLGVLQITDIIRVGKLMHNSICMIGRTEEKSYSTSPDYIPPGTIIARTSPLQTNSMSSERSIPPAFGNGVKAVRRLRA